MSNKKKLNLPAVGAVHAAAAAGLAVVADALTGRLHAGLSSLAGVAVGALLVVVLGWWMTRKHQTVRRHAKTLASHHVVRTAALAWIGVGLAVSGLAHIATLLGRPHGPVLGTGGAVVAGPFAAPQATGTGGGWVWVLLTAWAIAWVYGLFVYRGAFLGSGKGKDPVGGKRAPEKTAGAAFVTTVEGHERMVCSDRVPRNRIVLGQAELAKRPGGRMRPRWIVMPQEGSGLIFGSSGSGKSFPLLLTLLAARAPGESELPTKFVCGSAKVADLVGPTARHLRTLGTVHTWDITGHAASVAKHVDVGDLVRTSPTVHVTDWATGRTTAQRLVETVMSKRERDANQFWAGQMITLLGAALLAAKLDGKSYGDALEIAQTWADPDNDMVERVLSAHGHDDALRGWINVRKSLLVPTKDENGKVTWAEKKGSDQTGSNVASTLTSLMTGLDRPKARAATAEPNFDSHKWLREPGPSALIVIGDPHETQATKALMGPFAHDLLVEAYEIAQSRPDGKLPFRLVLLLDEMANTCPIPDLGLHYSLSRATRVQILGVTQDRARLIEQLGPEITTSLWNNAQAVMFTNGMIDQDTVRLISELGGTSMQDTVSVHTSGDGTSETTGQMARPLVDGHYMLTIQRPDPERGIPAGGLVVAAGGMTEVTIPLWSLHDDFAELGAISPDPDHRKLHEAHLARMQRRPGAVARRTISNLLARRHHRAVNVAATPETAAPVAEDHTQQPVLPALPDDDTASVASTSAEPVYVATQPPASAPADVSELQATTVAAAAEMPKLHLDGKRWICEVTYEQREVPKAAGFRWDPVAKRWWTDQAVRARKLAQYATSDAAAALETRQEGGAAEDAVVEPQPLAGAVPKKRASRVRAATPDDGVPAWPPTEPPSEVGAALEGFAGSRRDLLEAVDGGATSEAEARLLLGHMVAQETGGIEWGLAWDGTPQWRQPGEHWKPLRKAA